MIVSFLLFSLFWDAQLTPETERWLAEEWVTIDPDHPLHRWLANVPHWVESGCDEVTAACVEETRRRQPLSPVDYLPFVEALEDKRRFSSSGRDLDTVADVSPLLGATNRLVVRVIARPDLYPSDMLQRLLEAHRYRLATAPGLLDKMLGFAAVGNVVGAARAMKELHPDVPRVNIVPMRPGEQSLESAFIGDYRFAVSNMETPDSQLANLFYKPNHFLNRQQERFNVIVRASERVGCDLFEPLPEDQLTVADWTLNYVASVLLEVAHPAYQDYAEQSGRLGLNLLLSKAWIEEDSLSDWASPLSCWQAGFNAAQQKLCLTPTEDIGMRYEPICVHGFHSS